MTNSAPASTPEIRSFDIRGMTCAACSARLERVLKRTPGIDDARVNLALERADVALGSGTPLSDVVAAVDRAGFSAELRADDPVLAREQRQRREQEAAAHRRKALIVLAVCFVLILPFLWAMFAMLITGRHVLPAIAQLILAGAVQALAGPRFYRGAFNALRGGGANMDVLVSLGTTAAFGFSLYEMLTVSGMVEGHLYFEASAVVLTLVLFGKVLEERAKASTTRAVRSLMALRPETARRIAADGSVADVAITAILPGDRVLVRPGERVPVDGVIVTGVSQFDESVITGESLPVTRSPGDRVVTGAINGEGAIEATVDAVGEDSTLGRITRLVENAQSGKAPVQRLVDQVSAVFVPTVVGVAVVVFALWLASGSSVEAALAPAIAVLVIACPCALGLATPTALVAGTGAAARAGILIKDIEVLEQAAGVDAVLFDKTGTLTLGKPDVVAALPMPGTDVSQLMAVAGGVQAGSEHPLARATLAYLAAHAIEPAAATDVTAQPGRGVRAKIGDDVVLIGNDELMAGNGVAMADRPDTTGQTWTLAHVARDGKLIGSIGYADAMRPETPTAIAELGRRGLATLMLTGDNPTVAAAIAKAAGLDQWRAAILPEGKAREVEALRESGQRVAMIGDGVNDAPALAAADVGIAMGSGTDVAMETAGITLMRPDPRLVAAALDISRATVAKIRQNLFWAFVYNTIGIPLAALGLLTPALAGAAMAMSSVSVVTNAGLLTRWKPKLPPVRAPREG